MRIVICDDHELMVEGLSAAVTRAGHTVEALARTTTDGVSAVARYRPDLLLLDLSFPDGDSLDAAAEVVARHPGTKVVILTGSEDVATVRAALDLGVTSYLRKDQRIDTIIDGLERSARGERVVDDVLLSRLSRPADQQDWRTAVVELTPRERDVARLLRAGLNTAQMVDRLGIRESTVRRHVQTLLAKLCVHSRIEAVARLASVPLADLDDSRPREPHERDEPDEPDEREAPDEAIGITAGGGSR
jgi:DNA-binding NarL/FixJ family response regulator